MIAFLSGKLLEKQANTAIVDVGGVGYEVSIPLSTFYELGDVGSDVQLRIYTHVREDAIQLFGFKTNRERELYLRLISVQGVGAKSGITLLSGMSADEIISAIRSNNLVKLTSIPGVGKKTAERLVSNYVTRSMTFPQLTAKRSPSAPPPKIRSTTTHFQLSFIWVTRRMLRRRR